MQSGDSPRKKKVDPSGEYGVLSPVSNLLTTDPGNTMGFIKSLIAVAFLAAPLPASAQAPEEQSPKSAITIRQNDSLAIKASPELKKSLEELGAAVQALAIQIANDPQLRTAALQVATSFVNTAQQVVAENSGAIEEALKTAAERIASAEAKRKARSSQP